MSPKKNSGNKAPGSRKQAKGHVGRRKPPTGSKKQVNPALWFGIVGGLILLAGLLTVSLPSRIAEWRSGSDPIPDFLLDSSRDAEGPSLREIQAKGRIIDVHEHIQNVRVAPIYLSLMEELGIQKMCLMGSSTFTLTLDERKGFTGHDENNEELLKIVERYPGRFEAWVTMNPKDSDKLEKFKDAVSRGATGLKLYVGHGYINRQLNKGGYMFHTVALDDPGMLPVYAYCEENFIPLCMHVNPYEGRKGFAQEFVDVLTQFSDMKVDCPHFMLSSIQSSRLEEFLDTFPNLYTDVSFGDFFAKDGLKRISKSPKKFRRIFYKYQDRIMYASDLVLTEGRTKTEQWVREQLTAYLDMLSKEQYTSPAIPGEVLNGMALPGYILEQILYKNYERFSALRPEGTQITREINWERMNVEPVKRLPGQAFPNTPKE